MPELSGLIPWDKVTWDNMDPHSGAGHLHHVSTITHNV